MTAVRARSAVVVVGLLLSVGCVTTEARVRVVTRAGSLRDAVVVPKTLAPGLQIAVSTEAATDAELVALEQALTAHVTERLQGPTATTTTTTTVGELSVVRARVRASPGREQHRYLADCRLRLRVDGAVVAEADADVVRLVRASNLSLIELEAMRVVVADNGGRVPLLDADDVNAALLQACSVAFDAVAFDARPEDHDVDDMGGAGFAAQERSLDRKDQRRRVIDKLDKNAAIQPPSATSVSNVGAALIDLAAVGMLADAPRVARYLHDEQELLRRASELAFDTLCAGQATLAPTSTACRRPDPPPPPLPPAVVDDEGDDDGPMRDPTTTTKTDPAPAADAEAPAVAAPAAGED